MLERIEEKIKEKIEEILAKDEITMEDFQILMAEYSRLKMEADSAARSKSMMEMFANAMI